MTVLAIVFAVLGAACSAVGVRWQHDGVRAETGGGGLALRNLGDLARNATWLRGFGILFCCAVLQILALTFAPVTVVAPIVVLALPIIALLNPRGLDVAGWLAVAATTLAVTVFVWRTADEAVHDAVPANAVLWAGALVGGTAAVAVLVATMTSGLARCGALATAAGLAYGLVVVLVRDVTYAVRTEGLAALPVLSLLGLAVAFLAGSWLVQLGYASGPPDLVLGVQTLVNPAVATTIGIGLLGETGGIDAAFLGTLVGCGAVAVTGVAVLARHHPDAAAYRARLATERS
ncbi:hypothetical protein BJF85_17820 [Saccharomonospora sp. CUA-673]|uniref:hypothetical protein n=1 Tax=Saccharomonospora sp. CUA-673 TaxID=1904969 RepID=UPI00095C207D|nr:hypothetical protein [Saccharomonospora sp. CUA-673]OLT46050.1 hypothetical protein BJF85_17820 [Saccharomonospora sp. CUA-673]